MRFSPIEEIRPERDVLRCLPETREERQAILAAQDAFGIGAYDDGLFAGSLWFYRIQAGDRASPHAPPWSGWHVDSEHYPQIAARIPEECYPVLGLSCFHVGRTKAMEAEDRNDPAYFERGIGTRFLQTAVEWAAMRDYRAMLAYAGMDGFPDYNIWAGHLPLKAYRRQGFHILVPLSPEEMVPGHLRDQYQRVPSNATEIAVVIRHLVGHGD